MPRLLRVFAVLLLCLLPGRLASQQPYPRLARVIAAIRTAALVSRPVTPPHGPEPPDLDFPLPPLANRTTTSRRQVLRLNLTERLQLRATGDVSSPGLVGTLGLGVRF